MPPSTPLVPYTSIDYYQDNLKTNEVTIQKKELRKNQQPQTRDNVIFLYLQTGRAQLEINGQSFLIKEGQLIILMSYHVFALKKLPKEECLYYQCQFSIGLMLLTNTSRLAYHQSLIKLNSDLPIVTLTPSEQNDLLQICQKLALPEEDELVWARDLKVLSSIASVMYLFLTGLDRQSSLDKEPMNLAWQLLQYIHFHHQKQLSLADLSRVFSLSVTEITHLLKQLTGMSFSQNLNRVRIINGTALLEFNALSINQIGRIVGFQTDAYFYKEFKRVNQQTPLQYRQSFFPKHSLRIKDDGYDVYAYIYEHYRERLTITKIADSLNLTPKKTTQIVQENFKMSISDLLANIRISIARGLMLSTSLSLMDISEAVGFHDTKQFRHYFKFFYDQTPSSYRKNYQKKTEI